MRKTVITSNSSKPVGPYAQAVTANGFVFVSGIPPLDPETGNVVEGDIGIQTHRCMQNVREVLRAAGCEMHDVVKMMVYLTDMEDYAAMNAVYRSYFPEDWLPARTAPQVVRLPKPGAKIAVDAIAALPES